MNTNTPAQTEQNPTLNIDFSHRLASPDISDAEDLTDCILLMSDRLLGVLYMLSMSLGEGVRLSDNLTIDVLDSAINEGEDIKSLVKAFSIAESAKRNAQKNPEL